MKSQNKTQATLDLENAMAYCTGTEKYYRYLGFSKFLYTDGVKTFAEKAGAYWFIDLVFAELLKMQNLFLAIHLDVKDEKAVVKFKDCDDVVKTKNIPFTDCPEGNWLFFFDKRANVLLWNGEY